MSITEKRYRGALHGTATPRPEPICATCKDTHRMTLGERDEVPCTRCPTPCQRCRAGGNGPYCATTPCACSCHGARPEPVGEACPHGWTQVECVTCLRSALAAEKQRADTARADAAKARDLVGAQLLMVASALCGDAKPIDRSDPRWTPTLSDATRLRAALAAEKQRADRLMAERDAALAGAAVMREALEAWSEYRFLCSDIPDATVRLDAALLEADDKCHAALATDAGRPLLDELARLRGLAEKVNAIRNNIIGAQTVHWSEHVYPLVAALDAAGITGLPYPEARANVGTLLDRVAKLEAALRDVRDNFDCDEDAHRYGTTCRRCLARAALTPPTYEEGER